MKETIVYFRKKFSGFKEWGEEHSINPTKALNEFLEYFVGARVPPTEVVVVYNLQKEAVFEHYNIDEDYVMHENLSIPTVKELYEYMKLNKV